MKVLKNNYNGTIEEEKIVKKKTPYPRKMCCENCGSELEYEESDLRMGFLGQMFLDCPCCKYDNMLEDNENSIKLTKDNIEFPVHFWHTSKECGAVDICNTEEIRREINNAIDFFRENKDEYEWRYQSGNLHLHVYRFDGDKIYEVTVSNDFYCVEIPFEKEDY